MGLLPAALLLGVCVQAQNGKPDDPRPAAAELAAALKKTAAKGPFAFAGRLTTEVNPDDADEEPTACAVAGAAAPGVATVVQVQGDSSVHELLRRGNKVAGRETWKGHPLDLINAPAELLSLVDLDRLAIYVKDASSVKALPDEKSGAEDVSAYELAVPKATVRSFHDEAEAAEEEEKSLRGVTLRLRVRKPDGLVEKIDASVRRAYKDDDKPGEGTKGLSTYSLRLKDFGTADVVIPPGLEKLLKEQPPPSAPPAPAPPSRCSSHSNCPILYGVRSAPVETGGTVSGFSPKEYLRNLGDLPSLPAVAVQALAVAEDPSSTASDLLRVIMSDPPLAAKVLKVANSVHFHRGHAVHDLQTAIVRLGFSNVRNLLMGMSVIRAFNSHFIGAPFTREDFWVHSIGTAVLASRLSGESAQLCASSSFVMGLLHDIGQLVLDRSARESYGQVIRAAQADRGPLFAAERRRLGCDHAAIGAELLASWRFPHELVEPVRWHHEPWRCDAPHRPHAYLLQAADWICDEYGIGSSANEHPQRPSDEILRQLRVTEESVGELVRSVREEPLLTLLLPV